MSPSVRAWRPFAVVAAALVAACQTASVPPDPVRGELPTAVLVAPPRLLDGAVGVDALVMHGADSALRARGYRALPYDVGCDLVRAHALLPIVHLQEPGLARVQRELDVDGVLLVDVAAFDPGPDGADGTRYDLRWRLLSVTDGVVWERRAAGTWQRPRESPVDPSEQLDAPRPLRPLFVGPAPDPHTAAELAALLHLQALAHLPRARRSESR